MAQYFYSSLYYSLKTLLENYRPSPFPLLHLLPSKEDSEFFIILSL